jgi:hypothetical protein
MYCYMCAFLLQDVNYNIEKGGTHIPDYTVSQPRRPQYDRVQFYSYEIH